MMRTLKSGLTIGLLVAALTMTAGCGDNDNGDNGNDNTGPNPTSTPGAPVRTSTPGGATATPAPVPTVTPGGGTITANVGFNVTSTAGVQGFDLRIAYPSAKGSFTGAGEDVACTTTAAGTFIKNDNDTGSLTLIVANASNLTLPIAISCTFDATSALATSDVTVTVREVTQNGAPGDVSVLSVAVSIS